MPNGQTGLAEAYSVPIEPTLPPRPAVSDLQPRRKAAVPTGPEVIDYPKDIITGQQITQEFDEAWTDLQNYVGKMWTTYGINIQKPDPSSPAQGEAYRRYIQKLSNVKGLAANLQREAKAQTAFNLSVSKGQIIAPLVFKGKPFAEQQEWALQTAPFKEAIRQFNADLPKFYRPEDKERADQILEVQKQSLRNEGERYKKAYLAAGYSEEENKQYNEYIDTNVNRYISEVEANYVDWAKRATIALRATKEERLKKEAEIPADIKRAIDFLQAEKTPAGYTFDVTKKYKTREGTEIIYENVIKDMAPEEATQFNPKKARINEIYERTPIDPDITDGEGNPLIPEYHILSENEDYYLFVFEGGKSKILPVGEAARNLLLFGGYFATKTIEGKSMEYLAIVERGGGTKITPTKKEEVPTREKVIY